MIVRRHDRAIWRVEEVQAYKCTLMLPNIMDLFLLTILLSLIVLPCGTKHDGERVHRPIGKLRDWVRVPTPPLMIVDRAHKALRKNKGWMDIGFTMGLCVYIAHGQCINNTGKNSRVYTLEYIVYVYVCVCV